MSVKPDKQVAVTDVMALLRATYEGTDWDTTKNLKVPSKKKDSSDKDSITSPAANPWMTTDMINMLNEVKPRTGRPQPFGSRSPMFLLPCYPVTKLAA